MNTSKTERDFEQHVPVSYENYDYSFFWRGRDYENEADKIAVARLFSKIRGPRESLVDLGAGIGRMTPLYEKEWDELVLLDSSEQQIGQAKKNVSRGERIKFIRGTVQDIPSGDSIFDAALCVRTFHYVADAAGTVSEIKRILKPGGYLLLEIPNKLHFKNRFSSFFGSKREMLASANPINLAAAGNTTFLNHNPKTILKILRTHGFRSVSTLSVSNFRSGLLKKTLPLSLLLWLEKHSQRILAPLWFGPSIYFLVRKE